MSEQLDRLNADSKIDRIVQTILHMKKGMMWYGLVRDYIFSHTTREERYQMYLQIRRIINE